MQALRHYASLVRFSHTIFALPFALAAVVLASPLATVTVMKVVLIVVCIASARTAAMAFNRLVDREYDAANPRTQDREIPKGIVSTGAARALVTASVVLFLICAALLGRLPLLLSPVALGLALGYSYTKRFTSWCHVVLGAAIAFAPGGAWIALGAPLSAAPFLLVGGVATWVAGFDILYSLQDQEFDRTHGLHSVPTRLGMVGALVLSAVLHVVTVACLIGVGVALHRGAAFGVGVFLVTALLVVEHSLVRPNDLSKINRAFFDLNGYVSAAFFIAVLVDHFVRQSPGG